MTNRQPALVPLLNTNTFFRYVPPHKRNACLGD